MTVLQGLLLILCGVAVTLDIISWSGEDREWPPLYVGWGVVFIAVAGVLWQLMGKAIG